MLQTLLYSLHHRPAGRVLLLTALLVPFGASCSRPEPLQVGPASIPYEQVADALESMKSSFRVEGENTIRRNLLMFGMGSAALLHHGLPEESLAVKAEADAVAERLRGGTPFREELEAWAQKLGIEAEIEAVKQPYPSALGAAVAAAVASMEPGEWAGPLKTDFGWELVLLVERGPAARNRAQVTLYRMQFLVGTAADRQQAAADWSTLPLAGNAELIDCLALDFRADRVANPDSK